MRVLVVDDEPLVRRSLERIFLKNQHEVFLAENGAQGLSQWLDCEPDLVFLDVLMPEMSGLEVLQKVKNFKLKKTKIILMSAFTGDREMTDPQKVGADLFLAKPFSSIFDVYQKSMELMG